MKRLSGRIASVFVILFLSAFLSNAFAAMNSSTGVGSDGLVISADTHGKGLVLSSDKEDKEDEEEEEEEDKK